jgi:anti-sigma factor RsiW
MSENENIEAKLCSYVEGDLDAAGRAEIEKYLLAHPQYRPLIAELAKTRGLLRKLPRVSAPAELLETLSGQIERSALLDDDGHHAMRIRTSKLPHLAAWAAVLLLMTGLAAVIYRVLPSNKTPSELALLPAPQPASATQVLANDSQKVVLDQEQTPNAQIGAQAPAQVPAPAAAEAAAAPAMALATAPAM